MRKRMLILALCAVLVLSVTGCKFSLRETVEGETVAEIPWFDTNSTLICEVVKIEEGLLTVEVLEDNSNYDAEKLLLISCPELPAGLAKEDVITFTYNYVSDVSARGDDPYIVVEAVTVIENYEPPETTAETTEETEEVTEETA